MSFTLSDYFYHPGNQSESAPYLPPYGTLLNSLYKIKDASEIDNYSILLFGINEFRGSRDQGFQESALPIRQQFGYVSNFLKKIKVGDLGILRSGKNLRDTISALNYIFSKIDFSKTTLISYGGTQDLILPILEYFSNTIGSFNFTAIDSRIDSVLDQHPINSFVNQVIKTPNLFNINFVGTQQHYINPDLAVSFDKFNIDVLRLGELRENIHHCEPIARDSEILSIDLSAVRQSDAPAQLYPNPNGLTGEEACKIIRYFGLSPKTRYVHFANYFIPNDYNSQSANLIAQFVFYFLEGLENRVNETPGDNTKFTKYIVNFDADGKDLIFYRSKKTERWWIAVPKGDQPEALIIACNYSDYQTACNKEIPDIWWRTYNKIN